MPLSGYMFFVRQHSRDASLSTLSVAERGKKLGEMWRTMSHEQRTHMAEQGKLVPSKPPSERRVYKSVIRLGMNIGIPRQLIKDHFNSTPGSNTLARLRLLAAKHEVDVRQLRAISATELFRRRHEASEELDHLPEGERKQRIAKMFAELTAEQRETLEHEAKQLSSAMRSFRNNAALPAFLAAEARRTPTPTTTTTIDDEKTEATSAAASAAGNVKAADNDDDEEAVGRLRFFIPSGTPMPPLGRYKKTASTASASEETSVDDEDVHDDDEEITATTRATYASSPSAASQGVVPPQTLRHMGGSLPAPASTITTTTTTATTATTSTSASSNQETLKRVVESEL